MGPCAEENLSSVNKGIVCRKAQLTCPMGHSKEVWPVIVPQAEHIHDEDLAERRSDRQQRPQDCASFGAVEHQPVCARRQSQNCRALHAHNQQQYSAALQIIGNGHQFCRPGICNTEENQCPNISLFCAGSLLRLRVTMTTAFSKRYNRALSRATWLKAVV